MPVSSQCPTPPAHMTAVEYAPDLTYFPGMLVRDLLAWAGDVVEACGVNGARLRAIEAWGVSIDAAQGE